LFARTCTVQSYLFHAFLDHYMIAYKNAVPVTLWLRWNLCSWCSCCPSSMRIATRTSVPESKTALTLQYISYQILLNLALHTLIYYCNICLY